MGFIIHFYIIFGTNLLTEGPVQIAIFLPISVFRRKGISNEVQMEWNLWESYFWNKHNPGDLEWMSRKKQGGHEVGGRAQGRRHALHPRGPLAAPPMYFFLLYILIYPENIQEHHETLFPPPPLPRGLLVHFLTSTPSLLDHVCSKNHAPEGFIPFGLQFDIPFLRNTEIGK